ncbi:MAG: 30S ribosomal protein S3ae [Aigarchaeota archaeon]|nr:30S ribosomal protein S3ae [Aigarchaeota archaeon]
MSKKSRDQGGRVTIFSPPYFGGREIGQTFSSGSAEIPGRVVETSLYAITDDFSKQYLLMRFKVTRVADGSAETMFYGHEYGREYLRSLVRRGSTRVDGVFKVTTKDGYGLRVTVTAFTVGRTRSVKKKAIRKVMSDVVQRAAARLTIDQFAQELVLGKTASEIYNEGRKIALIRHVGSTKSKVISLPEEPGEQASPAEETDEAPPSEPQKKG